LKGNDVVKRAGELLRASASISTATSRATTSTRARPTSWSGDGFAGQHRAQGSEGVAKIARRFPARGIHALDLLAFAALVSYPVIRRFAAAPTIAATTARRSLGLSDRREEPRVRGRLAFRHALDAGLAIGKCVAPPRPHRIRDLAPASAGVDGGYSP
jgi:hypothetical protein